MCSCPLMQHEGMAGWLASVEQQLGAAAGVIWGGGWRALTTQVRDGAGRGGVGRGGAGRGGARRGGAGRCGAVQRRQDS